MFCDIYHGDSLEVLKNIPDESINMCVTSPPYYALRDYGVEGQIGLEESPQAYIDKLVEVFREVYRVLKKDGTLWVNIGDSYWGSGSRGFDFTNTLTEKSKVQQGSKGTIDLHNIPRLVGNVSGYKNKDLIGIPWMLAFALCQPYYTGKIKSESDRTWVASMMDAEGSFCLSSYKNNGRDKINFYISFTNASEKLIEKFDNLFPQEVKHIYKKDGVVRKQVYRVDIEKLNNKELFLREIYPYIVEKKKQCIIGYTFLQMQKGIGSKKKGYLQDQITKRMELVDLMHKLNAGMDVDLPKYCVEPPSLYEPMFYLRQDIIWQKPNCMPSSVTDRCTSSHEYIFLLSKSPKYFFDSKAIAEPLSVSSVNRLSQNIDEQDGSDRAYGKTNGPMKACATKFDSIKDTKGSGIKFGGSKYGSDDSDNFQTYSGNEWTPSVKSNGDKVYYVRNKRDVWSIPTANNKFAHFATFPTKLVEPCILAGCPEGGVVLDPFNGSGTTGVVALQNNRNYIGVELNEEYIDITKTRLQNECGKCEFSDFVTHGNKYHSEVSIYEPSDLI